MGNNFCFIARERSRTTSVMFWRSDPPSISHLCVGSSPRYTNIMFYTIQATQFRRHISGDTIQATQFRRHNSGDTNQATQFRRHISDDTIQATQIRRHNSGDTNQATQFRRHISNDTFQATQFRRHKCLHLYRCRVLTFHEKCLDGASYSPFTL